MFWKVVFAFWVTFNILAVIGGFLKDKNKHKIRKAPHD
jgi:hypothetical protein